LRMFSLAPSKERSVSKRDGLFMAGNGRLLKMCESVRACHSGKTVGKKKTTLVRVGSCSA